MQKVIKKIKNKKNLFSSSHLSEELFVLSLGNGVMHMHILDLLPIETLDQIKVTVISSMDLNPGLCDCSNTIFNA